MAMNKRARLNAVLLVAAAGLAAGIWFGREKEKHGPPLTALKPEQVTRIELAHPGGIPIRLEKKGSDWQLTSPVTGAADALEVTGILAIADRETKSTLDAAEFKPADLGLDPPKFTLRFNDTAIGFGDAEPLNAQRYVKTATGVYLIEDPPGSSLDSDWSDLAAKTVLPQDAAIEKIEVPGLTVTQADGKLAAMPAGAKATEPALKAFVEHWRDARAMWNEQAIDAISKGEPVTVTLKGGAQIKLLITDRDPQFKLYDPALKVRHVMSKALIDDLLKLPEVSSPAAAASPAPAGAPEPKK